MHCGITDIPLTRPCGKVLKERERRGKRENEGERKERITTHETEKAVVNKICYEHELVNNSLKMLQQPKNITTA